MTVSGGGGTGGAGSAWPSAGIPRIFTGSQGGTWDNVGSVGELVRQYLGILTPQEMLTNWISIRTGLIRDKAPARVIKDLSVEIGRLARDIRHHGP